MPAAAGAEPLPPYALMFGQGFEEPVELVCAPELDWLPVEVDVLVVLVVAKASPTYDAAAASTETASIE